MPCVHSCARIRSCFRFCTAEFAISGFRNRDVCTQPHKHQRRSQTEHRCATGRITHWLRLLRAYGLIRKVSRTPGGKVSLYLTEGGKLADSPAWTVNTGGSAHEAVLGDIDGDGDIDLAVGCQNQAHIYENVMATQPRD